MSFELEIQRKWVEDEREKGPHERAFLNEAS
jgi:hypothetical protein